MVLPILPKITSQPNSHTYTHVWHHELIEKHIKTHNTTLPNLTKNKRIISKQIFHEAECIVAFVMQIVWQREKSMEKMSMGKEWGHSDHLPIRQLSF